MYVYPGSDVCYSWEEGKEGGGGGGGGKQAVKSKFLP